MPSPKESTFSKAASSFLSPSRYELPRWRSPSPMTASIIPPPIVQSTYALSPKQRAAQSVLLEPSSPQQDRQTDLQNDLQYLLDAQAESLLKGLEGGAQDDASSTGSTTPTARSVRSGYSRRPARKKPGLRSARKGLYNTMLTLSATKSEELENLETALREKDERLQQIDVWERKRAGLQGAVQKIEHDEEGNVRVQRLREQAESVEGEIRELESRLEERRAVHRKMVRQLEGVQNEVQAKMASYTSSLKMLEDDVKKFLAMAPSREVASASTTNGDVQESVWQLPPARRTLDLAKEQFVADRATLDDQISAVSRERDALEDGAEIWRRVVGDIMAFEAKMREDMRFESSSPETATARLKDLLGEMDGLVKGLEGRLGLARRREWKLLVAAIGAEVDALQRGREILEGVLGVTGGEDGQNGDLVNTAEPLDRSINDVNGRAEDGESSGGEEIHGLDKSFETARPLHRRRSGSADRGGHSSEDDPDPELLFSQHEIDR